MVHEALRRPFHTSCWCKPSFTTSNLARFSCVWPCREIRVLAKTWLLSPFEEFKVCLLSFKISGCLDLSTPQRMHAFSRNIGIFLSLQTSDDACLLSKHLTIKLFCSSCARSRRRHQRHEAWRNSPDCHSSRPPFISRRWLWTQEVCPCRVLFSIQPESRPLFAISITRWWHLAKEVCTVHSFLP